MGFLVGAMNNHVINTVAKTLYIMSMKGNKRQLNRFLAVNMGAQVMSRVTKVNLEPRRKVSIAVAVQEQKLCWREEDMFLYFLRLFR